ncbi:MAG: hypothetical protein CMJ75_18370 [Planctomycetaceae bacterium]|nr:hypothetical protein [Planctomycetaceae bacterium]
MFQQKRQQTVYSMAVAANRTNRVGPARTSSKSIPGGVVSLSTFPDVGDKSAVAVRAQDCAVGELPKSKVTTPLKRSSCFSWKDAEGGSLAALVPNTN